MASFFDTLSTIWTNVKPILPAAAEGVGSYLSYLDQTEGTDDAAKQYAGEQQRAADILKGGYNQQLAETESGLADLEKIYREGYGNTSGILSSGADEYGRDLRRSVSTYSDMIYPEYDVYGDNMYANAEGTNKLLDETGQEYEGYYQPYTEAGAEALSGMRATAAADPNTMTPEQEIALEDYDRNAAATLAASGLRGAGRAGVAAILDGRQRLKAGFIKQNQDRSDRARETIGSQGFTATGNVANNNSKVGFQQASNLYNTGQDVAKTGFDTSKDVANKYLTAEGSNAANKMNTVKSLVDLTGKLYGGLSDITQGKTEARGNTALQKASADAAVIGNTSGVNYNTNIANTRAQGDTIGKIANSVSNAVKAASNGTPATGGSSTTPWRYENPAPPAVTYQF